MYVLIYLLINWTLTECCVIVVCYPFKDLKQAGNTLNAQMQVNIPLIIRYYHPGHLF